MIFIWYNFCNCLQLHSLIRLENRKKRLISLFILIRIRLLNGDNDLQPDLSKSSTLMKTPDYPPVWWLTATAIAEKIAVIYANRWVAVLYAISTQSTAQTDALRLEMRRYYRKIMIGHQPWWNCKTGNCLLSEYGKWLINQRWISAKRYRRSFYHMVWSLWINLQQRRSITKWWICCTEHVELASLNR